MSVTSRHVTLSRISDIGYDIGLISLGPGDLGCCLYYFICMNTNRVVILFIITIIIVCIGRVSLSLSLLGFYLIYN